MTKREEIKNDNFVLYNSLAQPACLAALWSAAACVSGIVLEGGVQKQQGAEDKQAIRDSLNTATLASTVEGCEDPRSNRAINPPLYQLEQASVSRAPHHATPPIISNKPYLSDRPPPFSNTLHLHNRPDWLSGDLQVH